MYWIISKRSLTYETGVGSETSKFTNDVWSADLPDFLSVSYGVILNRKALEKEFPNKNLFVALYQLYGEDFPKHLKGSFSGVLFDKHLKKWIFFTNHTGDHKLFYAETSDELIVSNSIFKLNEVLKQRAIATSFNIGAAYQILGFGYLFNNNTLLNEVKRLTAGRCLVLKAEGLKVHSYFLFSNSPQSKVNEQEILHQLNEQFKTAICSEYDKDREYDLPHFASLSGGLDSRMTCWVAEQEGYAHDFFYTFSQSNYPDMTIAKKIGIDLNRNWFFIPLDGGDYLKEIDFIVKESNGLVGYSGPSTAYTSHKKLDFSSNGLLHTGQLGDVTVGSYCTKESAYKQDFDIRQFKLSDKLLHKVTFDTSEYENNEMAMIYNRGFNGVLTGNFSLHRQTEVVSPFLYPDFMDFALKIPVEMRSHHQLYRKWIIASYPAAAKYKWESIHAKITAPVFRYKQFHVPYSHLPEIAWNRMTAFVGINYFRNKKRERSMNPFEVWYRTNASLAQFTGNYFNNHLDLITDKTLKTDCEYMFKTGTFIEKLQVLTLLSFLKQI